MIYATSVTQRLRRDFILSIIIQVSIVFDKITEGFDTFNAKLDVTNMLGGNVIQIQA